MILLPVIERELRSAARQSFTYLLRVLGVVALLLVVAGFALRGALGPDCGGELFRALHGVLFFAIWLMAPLLTADCISRERREGTLPLLFLTPLKPPNIVWAKSAAHGLRAFSLWLAVVPVLAICLVAGGLGWVEIVISVLVNFSAICIAMAAGLVASAFSRVWTRAMAVAMLLAFAFFLAYLWLILVCVGMAGGPWNPDEFQPWDGLSLALNLDGAWQSRWGTTIGGPMLLRTFELFAPISFGALVLLVRFAAWRVKRTWPERPASARMEWLKNKLFSPAVFAQVLRRWLRWELQRNPIGWLERRSWSGRLVVWSWLAVVTCIYSSVFANLGIYSRGFHSLQMVLAWLLAGSIAVSAAGSFRRERETGVLELLLVAPLREWQIIGGRVRGLWGQFLPSIILLCAVWLYGASFLSEESEWLPVLLFLVTFATLPIVGLYFSLTRSNFVVALLCTVVLQMLFPVILEQVAEFLSEPALLTSGYGNSTGEDLALRLLAPLFQLLLALFLGWRLLENLRHRSFAMEGRGA
jgi:ABC-type transport system involved in multi-copper enzyme maturation permease subunit